MVRWMWLRGVRRAIACAIPVAALAGGGTAAADVFHYVDRDGRAHRIDVAPPAEAPVLDQASLDPAGEYPFADAVKEAARLYSLPPELILAVITIESGFDPRALSPRGAMGLMQLMPGTAAEMKIGDAFDPRDNILGGARLLRILLNSAAGDPVVALGAYNAGSGATQRYGGVPPYRDTHDYVVRVVQMYRVYQARGPAFASVVAASIRSKKSVPYRLGSGIAPAAAVVDSPIKTVVDGGGARARSGEEQARPRRPTRRRRGDG